MHFTTLTTSVLAIATVAQAACHAQQSGHRRHHSKLASSAAASGSGSGSGSTASLTPAALAAQQSHASSHTSASAGKSGSASTTTKTSSAATSTSTSSLGWSLSGMKKNGIWWGFLPDDGSGGGTAQSMSQINAAMGQSSAAQGWYAQAQSGVAFDGSQLTSRMDQIVAAGGVFQPAIMPTGGWQGLTASDNSQAVNICNVLKKFTDKGLEVWLRFAHEVNWYQSDGTYTGGVSDFKAGWAAVAAACKSIAPEVKMWYTPNVADDTQYDEYFPDDISTVDLIGVDWYPSDPSTSFVSGVKNFHDKYTSSTLKFAQGETGLASGMTINDRLTWVKQLTSSETASALPNYIATSWFNYYKGYDFRIAAVSGDSVTKAYFA
ncbi:hypothetical protein T439DRAFT_323118 [Meredithblackwellia eburnea MCA 4105]